jgi:hypothetical protein
VLAAELSPDQLQAQWHVQASKRGAAHAHEVLSVQWLRDVDAAGALVDIM